VVEDVVVVVLEVVVVEDVVVVVLEVVVVLVVLDVVVDVVVVELVEVVVVAPGITDGTQNSRRAPVSVYPASANWFDRKTAAFGPMPLAFAL